MFKNFSEIKSEIKHILSRKYIGNIICKMLEILLQPQCVNDHQCIKTAWLVSSQSRVHMKGITIVSD